jgi:predicted Zn-dependent protease
MTGTFQSIARIWAAAAFAVALAAAPAFSQGLIRDTEIEAVMREYTDPMLVAAELDPDAVDIYLIGDMSFNAFVTQGQNIFLHTGLIIRAENPGEIKGVIAHEIGHIQGAHLARIGDAQRGGMATMAASLGIGIIAALAGAPDAGAAIIASGPQFATLDMLRYSRGQEASADQAAVRLLTATEQSGRGLVSTFERLAYQERLSFARRWEYFRSHPLSTDRVAALRRNVEESPFADVPDSPEEIAELQRIQAKIIGFMAPPGQTFDRYPETDDSLPAHYARSVAWFKQGRTDRAIEEVDALLQMEPDNPFFHELQGQILFESGRIADSIAPQRRALEFLPDAPLFKIYLSRSLIAEGEEAGLREAVTLLSQALVAEPDNSFGWFQKSLAHQALGEVAMAELATAERYYAVGDEMQAHIFAQRAQNALERGTEAWIRASEILAVTQPTDRELREWNRRERERRPNFMTQP